MNRTIRRYAVVLAFAAVVFTLASAPYPLSAQEGGRCEKETLITKADVSGGLELLRALTRGESDERLEVIGASYGYDFKRTGNVVSKFWNGYMMLRY
ncbi:MAG: hypothetical protein LBQ12_03950 [Deltaproteobacteria bacterium]|jgi:predicted secreted protein|nr:hypothetical protein [Deltaproteobacteria bacterium]